MQKGSLNRVILIGNVGQDPESKYMPSGTALCNFSLATNETWNDGDGNPQSRTEWHRCEAFGKPAETISQWVKKGQMLLVEGMIRSREYTDKDGVNRRAYAIRVENFTMLGKRDTSDFAKKDESFPNKPESNSSADNDEVPF